jgi:transposase InsO family protein
MSSAGGFSRIGCRSRWRPTFCTEALEEALARHGKPDIFYTDQGSQFTSVSFTGMLLDRGVSIRRTPDEAYFDRQPVTAAA